MTVTPLHHEGDVTLAQFAEYLRHGLGEKFHHAAELFALYGPIHSFSFTNVLYMGLQCGKVDRVLKALEEWAELAYRHPIPEHALIRREADTRQFFDVIYGDVFREETADLLGGGRRSRLIVPGQPEPRAGVIVLPLGVRLD